MKKIKYFMPALAIASVASGVTPMITSCKGSSEETVVSSWDYEFVKDKKVISYESQVAAAEKKTYDTVKELNDAYINDVKNNPHIFADEYFSYLSYMFGLYKTYLLKYCTYAKATVSNVSVNRIASKRLEQEVKLYRYTYLYSYDFTLEFTPIDDDLSYAKYEFSYKNEPYYLDDSGSQGKLKYWYTAWTQNRNITDFWGISSPSWYEFIKSAGDYTIVDYPFPSLTAKILEKDADGNFIKNFSISVEAVHDPDDSEYQALAATLAKKIEYIYENTNDMIGNFCLGQFPCHIATYFANAKVK